MKTLTLHRTSFHSLTAETLTTQREALLLQRKEARPAALRRARLPVQEKANRNRNPPVSRAMDKARAVTGSMVRNKVTVSRTRISADRVMVNTARAAVNNTVAVNTARDSMEV